MALKPHFPARLALVAGLAATALPHCAAASCGSAACLVNTQWQIHGIPTEAGGTLFQLQYDYIRQDQLYAGSHKTSVAPEGADALEQKTVSQTVIASLDYTFDQRWGMTATLPVVKRVHDHLADPYDDPTPESWDFTRLGDARIVGRYRFIASDGYDVGAQFGVVLPTGPHNVDQRAGRRRRTLAAARNRRDERRARPLRELRGERVARSGSRSSSSRARWRRPTSSGRAISCSSPAACRGRCRTASR